MLELVPNEPIEFFIYVCFGCGGTERATKEAIPEGWAILESIYQVPESTIHICYRCVEKLLRSTVRSVRSGVTALRPTDIRGMRSAPRYLTHNNSETTGVVDLPLPEDLP